MRCVAGGIPGRTEVDSPDLRCAIEGAGAALTAFRELLILVDPEDLSAMRCLVILAVSGLLGSADADVSASRVSCSYEELLRSTKM